jgi:hypothetical protein
MVRSDTQLPIDHAITNSAGKLVHRYQDPACTSRFGLSGIREFFWCAPRIWLADWRETGADIPLFQEISAQTIRKERSMGEAVNQLVGHMSGSTGFDIPFSDLRALQLAALNERLEERVDKIKLLNLRARDAGITQISALEDIVALLLPHTAYKSYPERFLIEKRWDKLTKWLETVSTYPIENVELNGITGIDDWVNRLAQAGHLLSCSSGTTGNPAMLMSSRADADFAGKDGVAAMLWGSEIKPDADRKMMGFGMVTATPRGSAMGGELVRAFIDPAKERFSLPIPPITIGSVTEMITLRKAITDGTAKPDEIAEFDAKSAARQQAVDGAFGRAAEAAIEARHEKLYITGYWG